MEITTFLFGILTGVYFVQGAFFLSTRRRRYPFREAYGWTMLMGTLVLTTEVLLNTQLHYDWNDHVPLYFSIDMLVLPFYMLEIACIVNQDVKLITWRVRWLSVLLIELPIVFVLLLTIFSESVYVPMVCWSFFLFLGTMGFVYMYRSLRKYSNMLPVSGKEKHQDVKWMWYVLGLYLFQCVLYLFVTQPVPYLLFSTLTILLHGYYVNRQSALDTTKFSAVTVKTNQPGEPMEEVREKENRKMDQETYMASFVARHPQFKERIVAHASAKITKRDMYLCMMIAEGKRISEIAEHLAISPTSVEVARHRLRTKLDLEKGVNLNTFIKERMGD